MNLFQVDFLGKMATLLKAAFSFKKYRAMHPVLAVFTGILMIPVVLLSFVATAMLAVISFAFAVLSAPVKYIHGIVNNEGKEVKHATQAIIYLISWPMIFAFYIAMSALLLALLPVYALTAILLYTWSIGGFKFHLFPNTVDDISIEAPCKFPAAAMIIGSISFFIIPAIHGAITYVILWTQYLEKAFVSVFFGGMTFWIYVIVYAVYMALYASIGIPLHVRAKKAKTLTEAEAPAEPEQF